MRRSFRCSADFWHKGENEKADRLASAVITWTALTTVVLGLLSFALADPLMRYVVAPDLPPDAMDLAIKTMRMLLLSPLLLGMGIAAKGILETHLKFVLPALAPVVYNLAIVLAALFLAPTYGIEGVTIGVLIGALLTCRNSDSGSHSHRSEVPADAFSQCRRPG